MRCPVLMVFATYVAPRRYVLRCELLADRVELPRKTREQAIAAYAQRFGATGLTFLDDEVTEFFSPHARGKSVMFLVALGRSRRRG